MEAKSFKNDKLKTISIIVFIGVFAGIIRSYFGSYIFHNSYPLNTFLFDPADRFNDLLNMIRICSTNSPYINAHPFASNYFPVANSIFYLLSFITNNKVLAVLFLGVFVFLYTKIIIKYLEIHWDDWRTNMLDIIIIFLFSYPIFFNVDRLNIEIYNFLLCLLWMYFKDNKKPWLAILFLSLSIALKLYTGVFIILYLKEKKYKEVAAIFLIVLFTSLLSIYTFKGGILPNIYAMLAGMKSFTETYADVLHYNLSLFNLIKVLYYAALKVLHLKKVIDFNNFLFIYTAIILFSFLGVIYIVFKKNLPQWMNLFLLVSVLILFPHVSFDYKLIFIYLPLIYYLKDIKKAPYNKVYSIGFGCLLIPHNYIYLVNDASIAIIIYPVVILIMAFLIIYKSNFDVVN